MTEPARSPGVNEGGDIHFAPVGQRRPPNWLAPAAAAAGFALYLALSWHHARTQASVLDEGLYLYKGWLFAAGRYTPFQDFGPWTNHMPLSFLVPGWIQVLFGPGLRTGRILALATGLLSLTGIWALARRFGGSWWGAAAVWAVALNPAVTKIFSIQASQGLAACILIGAFVLTLGEGRRNWELAAGGVLAGALALTRINLSPVLPLLAIYVFLVHGRRAGILFTAVGLGLFIALHAVFWPGILRMWAPWFPEALTPFLDPFRRPPNDGGLWAPEVDLRGRTTSFLQGLRFHLVPISAAVAALAFWPGDGAGWTRSRRLTAVFLLGLFGLLFGMHAWASLAQDYCVFCFPIYLSFFSLIGLFLVPLTFRHWTHARPGGRLMAAAVLLAGAVLGASAASVVGPDLLGQPSIVRLLRTEIPRTSGPGTIPLWGLVENISGRDYETIVRTTLFAGRVALAGLIGLGASLAALALARRLPLGDRPFAHRAAAWFIVFGLLLSPSRFLAGGYTSYNCTGDVIAAYESAGRQLAAAIPPDAQVFWGTGGSPVPLLYLPYVRIYPAQLNGAFSFKFGGDPEALNRFGHWNRDLAEAWIRQSDVVLTNIGTLSGAGTGWLSGAMETGGFERTGQTGLIHPCDPGSEILIFTRK
jgi:hypothetical protein